MSCPSQVQATVSEGVIFVWIVNYAENSKCSSDGSEGNW